MMELRTLPILALLSVVLVASHAADVPPEIYWKKVLRNTPMPKAIRNSLPQPEWMEDKSTSVYVGKGGVTVNVEPHKGAGATKGKPSGGHTNVNVGPKGAVGVSTGKPGGGHTNVNVGPKGGVGISVGNPSRGHTHVGGGVTTGKPGGRGTNVNVGPKGGFGVSTGKPGGGHGNVGVSPKGGVGVSTGKPGKRPVYVGVKPDPSPFDYNYAASETQLEDDSTRALFFLENDMKLGSHISAHFTQSTNGAIFLPREEAEPLPFSSDKISNILHTFSIQPGSKEAHIIQDTINECETKPIQGEQKFCATSLESMIDSTTSIIGKNVKAISTEVKGDDSKARYTISKLKKLGGGDEAIACHKKNYMYAVFYCHRIKDTSAYILSLVGENGSMTKAVAVCHKDTGAWNPKHLAFKVLNVKPGSVPICHFLPEDHIVWAPTS